MVSATNIPPATLSHSPTAALRLDLFRVLIIPKAEESRVSQIAFARPFSEGDLSNDPWLHSMDSIFRYRLGTCRESSPAPAPPLSRGRAAWVRPREGECRSSASSLRWHVSRQFRPWRLKYCTSRSCFSALARVEKVPRFLRLPVVGSGLREYNRYSPDFSLRIMSAPHIAQLRGAKQ